MGEIRYTKDHEWVQLLSANTVRVGITKHANDLLGDIVFVELPEIGKFFNAGADAAVVESVKAASEVYMPLSGKILAINEGLITSPEMVNSDPLQAGWFFDVTVNNPADFNNLLSESDYLALIKG